MQGQSGQGDGGDQQTEHGEEAQQSQSCRTEQNAHEWVAWGLHRNLKQPHGAFLVAWQNASIGVEFDHHK